MNDLTGKTLGQYELEELIGRGGMASVYKAYQSRMRRHVAIKVLPEVMAVDPNYLARFEREAQTIARLEHRSILPVYDYGQQDNITYIVMRYVNTGTLADRMKRGDLSYEMILRITQQVAAALDYAHQQGIIHRDLKPDNIFIDSQGDAILGDFGIAQIREGTQELTGSAIVGTPAYMSPEQGQGEKLDGRSDVYALGVILFELFTGAPPYQAETPMGLVVKHITGTMPNPLDFKPDLPARVATVILKSTAKDRSERYQTTIEMANALRDALAGYLDTQIAPLQREFNPDPAPVLEMAEVVEVASPDSGFNEQPEEEPSVTSMFKDVMRKQAISLLESRSQKLDAEREKRATQAEEKSVEIEAVALPPLPEPTLPPAPTPTTTIIKQRRSPVMWILSTLGVIFICISIACVALLALGRELGTPATTEIIQEEVGELVVDVLTEGGPRSNLNASWYLEPNGEFSYFLYTPDNQPDYMIDISVDPSEELDVLLQVQNSDTGDFVEERDDSTGDEHIRFPAEPNTTYQIFVVSVDETEGEYDLWVDAPKFVTFGWRGLANMYSFTSREEPLSFYYFPDAGEIKTFVIDPFEEQDIKVTISNPHNEAEPEEVVFDEAGDGEEETITYEFSTADSYLVEIEVKNKASGGLSVIMEE